MLEIGFDNHLRKHGVVPEHAARDISFLDRHDHAVYHPAGRHIASAGPLAGEEGLWLATNEGRGAVRIVRTEDGEGGDGPRADR